GKSFAIARRYGDGRILAVGHEGFLGYSRDADRLFLDIALTWLRGNRDANIIFSSNHKEVFNQDKDAMNALREKLTSPGWEYMIDTADDLADYTKLTESTGVLIVGNAEGEFKPGEIEEMDTFVKNGGGLLAVGLGRAWQ